MLGVLGGSIGACSGMIATIMLSLVQGLAGDSLPIRGARRGSWCPHRSGVFGVPGVGGIP